MTSRARNGAGALLEDGFQAQVIGLARLYQWRLIYHAPDNRPAGRTGRPQRLAAPEGRGFPDLVLLRPPELIVAELKSDTGRIGPGQEDWIAGFAALGRNIAELVQFAVGAGVEFGDNPLEPVDEPAVDAYIWRPRDWDEVQQRLSRGRTRVDL